MTTNTTQVKIKIFEASLEAVKAEANLIKSFHSVYIESEYLANDNGKGYRVYLTVPVENNCTVDLPRQEIDQRTAKTPLSFNLTELTSK
jgi:hypothetical protein